MHISTQKPPVRAVFANVKSYLPSFVFLFEQILVDLLDHVIRHLFHDREVNRIYELVGEGRKEIARVFKRLGTQNVDHVAAAVYLRTALRARADDVDAGNALVRERYALE